MTRARFLVTRTLLAGRGSMCGPDSQDSQQELYYRRPLGLWQTVAELATMDGIADGSPSTEPRSVDGWDESEVLEIERAHGLPLDPRMRAWLLRAAGLERPCKS